MNELFQSKTQYVGVKNFESRAEVDAMLLKFREHVPFGMPMRLRIGAALHYQSFNDPDAGWLAIYPRKEFLSYILSSEDAYAYNCLQYMDSRRDGFHKELSRAILYGGTGVHAVQLDMLWPNPDDILRGVGNVGQKVEIILNLSQRMLNESNRDVVRRLENYQGIIHRVFLNKGAGCGFAIDVQSLILLISAIREEMPDLGITVAGGFDSEKTVRLRALVAKFPDVSIDAQGKQDPNSPSCSHVGWSTVSEFLVKTFDFYKVNSCMAMEV